MGAYQGSSLAFIAQRGSGQAQRLIAPTPYLGNDPDRANPAYVTEGSFDAERGMLSMATKGRGLAYNRQLMQKVARATGDHDWSGTSILAHEIGHHLSGHTLLPGDSKPPIELEADKF